MVCFAWIREWNTSGRLHNSKQTCSETLMGHENTVYFICSIHYPYSSLSINQTVNGTQPQPWCGCHASTLQKTCRITHSFPLTVTEKRSQGFLPKHVGVQTPGERGRWAGFATERKQSCSINTSSGPAERSLIHTQSSLPDYCKCPRLLGSPRLGMAWKWQQKQREAQSLTVKKIFWCIQIYSDI